MFLNSLYLFGKKTSHRKKHIDHHPERETLVQELGELQNRFEIEIGARRALEKDHGALQHELLQLRLNSSSVGGAGGGGGSKVLLLPPPPASPATSLSGSGGASSPTSSIRSSTFSFLGGSSSGRKKNRVSISNERPASTKITRMTEAEEVQLVSPQSIHRQQQQSQSLPQTPSTPSRTWTTHVTTPQQRGEDGVQLVQDPDHEMLGQIQSGLPSWEQLETDKIMYEQLRDENVSMRMELNDLRYRNQAEKNSVSPFKHELTPRLRLQSSSNFFCWTDQKLYVAFRESSKEASQRPNSGPGRNRSFAILDPGTHLATRLTRISDPDVCSNCQQSGHRARILDEEDRQGHCLACPTGTRDGVPT